MGIVVEKKNDYNRSVKMKSNRIQCYNKKLLKRMYPDNGYRIVGETKRIDESVRKGGITATYDSSVSLSISNYKENSRLFYREAGYLSVGSNRYIVVLKRRLLLWISVMLAMIGITILLLWNPFEDKQVSLIEPLPDVDKNIVILPDGDDDDMASGGQSVSMSYVLEAKTSLSTREIGIYFANPHKSNQDVVLELYVIGGDEDVLLATSGRIPRGNSLTKMTAEEKALSRLKTGSYEAYYKIICYDSTTEEKALVEPKITDVQLTVIK